MRNFAGHAGHVTSLCVKWDEMKAISASHDKTVRWWDLAQGELLKTVEGSGGPIWSVTVDWDRGKLGTSSGSGEHGLRLWDLDSGVNLHTLLVSLFTVWVFTVDWKGRKEITYEMVEVPIEREGQE